MHSVYKNGQTSVILRVKLLDTSSTTGAGLTGLTSATTGLQICTIADNEATGVNYTVAASTIESITTIGTYAAPTATKCRFKVVDATYHSSVYEIHLANARLAVAGAKSMIVSIKGAANLQECDFLVLLWAFDPYQVGSALVPRDIGELDRGVAVAVTTDTITLEVGTKEPQSGSVVEFMDGAYEGWIATYNNYVAGTRVFTGDPGFPAGAVGTFPTYRILNQPNALTKNPVDVELSPTTRALLVDEVWDEVITTGHAVANSAAVKLVAPVGVELSTASRGLIVDEVWDEVITAGHVVVNSAAVKLAASGAAADPLDNPVPGTYAIGTFGHAIGTRLDVAVSSRAAESGGNLSGVKNKTDQMSFGVANTQNVNVTHVNEQGPLTGDGITVGIGVP